MICKISMAAILKNDVIQVVDPNLVTVASTFHVKRGPRKKIKQVS